MMNHRCPWCGEWLPIESRGRSLIRDSYRKHHPLTCPHCKKPYRERWREERPGVVWVALLMMLGYVLACLGFQYLFEWLGRLGWRIPDALALLVVAGLCLLLFYLLPGAPFERCESALERARRLSAGKAAEIRWEAAKAGGLRWPRLHVSDGEIFPAYFLDAGGRLISAGLCVAMEEIVWTGARQCSCHISLVLDDVPAERYLRPGNRFYLYQHYRRIAEGVVKASQDAGGGRKPRSIR